MTQKLPQIYTANHTTFPIRLRKITVQICGNFWVTQYNSNVHYSGLIYSLRQGERVDRQHAGPADLQAAPAGQTRVQVMRIRLLNKVSDPVFLAEITNGC